MADLFVAKDQPKSDVTADYGQTQAESVQNPSQIPSSNTNPVPNANQNTAPNLDAIRNSGRMGALKYPKSEEERERIPGFTKNPLASFNIFPEGFDFINKDPEEKIILLLRKHPITNLTWILATMVLFILPAFFSVMPTFESLPKNMQILLLMVWYLITFSFAFEKFLTWFFNVNIITDERVFDVNFVSLIYREMTDAEIAQIQDVTVQLGGGIRTLFNYGDLYIQTAGEVPRIIFEEVPFPDRVAKVLRELRVEEEIENLEGRVR